MKDKITRLHFKEPQKRKIETGGYEIYWNTNEETKVLDISIHHSPQTDPKKVFTYMVNDTKPPVLIQLGEDEIITKKVKGISIDIYQFSIPFTELFPKDNNITFYEKNEQRLIGTLELFTETEDNFINVRLERPGTEDTDDQALWKAIKLNLQFAEYERFIDRILCHDTDEYGKKGQPFNRETAKNRSPFIGTQEYNLIKFGTEFYMLSKFGLDKKDILNYLGANHMLPYYDIIVDRIKDDLHLNFRRNPEQDKDPNDCRIREYNRLTNPFMIELIWSYWMEQAGLVQTLNVINLRFQNIKGSNMTDRLQRFDVDPLRPLSHILWGYIQDEQHRLSIPRRLNEYDHEYGLILTGRAVPNIRPIDSRVQFLEAFHNLLNQALAYYKESDDTTRIADAFPILNSLKEVHLLLAEGNHNAYGNLTWTARQEMMMQQYILARSEMRDFLGGRTMVPYAETWMDRVDSMRSIQGWAGPGVMYYYELALHGEQILLSIRYGNWSDVTLTGENAANWAKEFRNSVQRYVHAYRSVTGVDLSAERVQLTGNFAVQPAYLIRQRMLIDKARMRRA